MKKIVILGAGISGLSLGFFLKKKYQNDLDLTILEKKSSSGGWIRTIKKNGYLFELGPRSCRTTGNGVKTLQLIEDLGLKDEVITADSSAKNRFIYTNKRMECFPKGIFSLFRSPLTPGLLKPLCRDLFQSQKPREIEESIHEFISRKFNVDLADNLFDPLTSGIYAGDCRQLSFKSCFPDLYDLEKKHGSLLRGMFLKKNKTNEVLSSFVKCLKKNSLFSFKNGMQTLPKALSERLNEHIMYETNIIDIKVLDDKVVIRLKDEKIIEADYLFSTISAKDLGNLIDHLELKDCLKEFDSTSCAVVSFGFKTDVLKEKGFGYLIPSKENEEVLGVVFDSAVFKEQNQCQSETRLTVMIGGARMTYFDQYTQDDFIVMAKNALKKHLKIYENPHVTHVELAKNAIPQYLIGHSGKVAMIKNLSPSRLKILGSSFFGVSVNDCVANSKIISDHF